jgi:hypothetical protein
MIFPFLPARSLPATLLSHLDLKASEKGRYYFLTNLTARAPRAKQFWTAGAGSAQFSRGKIDNDADGH